MSGGLAGEGLPTELGGLFALALRAYVKRLPFYLALQAAAFLFQLIFAFVHPAATPPAGKDEIVFITVATICDAFVLGAISIGVLADVAGIALGHRAILDRATARWWAVTIVLFVGQYVGLITAPLVLTFDLQQSLFGLGTLAALLMLAAMQTATVVAAADERLTGWRVVPFALGRGLSLAVGLRNLSRGLILGVVMTIPNIISLVLFVVLKEHNAPMLLFWANVPVDEIFIGVVQAIFAVFSLDLARRLARP